METPLVHSCKNKCLGSTQLHLRYDRTRLVLTNVRNVFCRILPRRLGRVRSASRVRFKLLAALCGRTIDAGIAWWCFAVRHTRVEGDVPPGLRIFDSIDFVRPDREPNPPDGAIARLRGFVLDDKIM